MRLRRTPDIGHNRGSACSTAGFCVTSIPLHSPTLDHAEVMRNLKDVIERGALQGNGRFTDLCHDWLSKQYGTVGLLTHSCTAALDMAMMLADLTEERNEVILPSFTFVSTATCIINSGGTPVFVDVDPSTCNIDPAEVAKAVTPRTAAVIAVHYGGVCADMDALAEICNQHQLLLVEDAAQAFLSEYKGRQACTLSDLACLSFHETKNVVSGEGGALIVNDASLIPRARIIRDKGTDRHEFMRPDSTLDKYTWQDKGSSYLPSELIAAVLHQQFNQAQDITRRRVVIWQRYQSQLGELSEQGKIHLADVPSHCQTNGHIFYLRCADGEERGQLLKHLHQHGIGAAFHYIPLHSSRGAARFGARSCGDLAHTDTIASTIVRLPAYAHMTEQDIDTVVGSVRAFYGS